MSPLRMADGPIENLPGGFDAYAGYVDESGIGVTYPGVVARFPSARHLSISVVPPGHPADCADVEAGGLSSWAGFMVGYSGPAEVAALRAQWRPAKIWTAHYWGPTNGPHRPHICGPATCGPTFTPPLDFTADGTQWTDHPELGGAYDESLLADDFFSFQDPPPAPKPKGGEMIAQHPKNADAYICVSPSGAVYSYPSGSPDAVPYKGGPSAQQLAGATCIGIAVTPSGQGYRILSSSGGVFCYGDAAYEGAPNWG